LDNKFIYQANYRFRSSIAFASSLLLPLFIAVVNLNRDCFYSSFFICFITSSIFRSKLAENWLSGLQHLF